jgi:hypothetical protein
MMFKDFPKIVRIVTRLNIGGPAIHTILLSRELPALGYRSVLVAGDCEDGKGDMSYLLDPSDLMRRIPGLLRSVSPARNLRALWWLWRVIRNERPAIVHTHTAMAGCLGGAAAILAGVPVVIHTFHGNRRSRRVCRRGLCALAFGHAGLLARRHPALRIFRTRLYSRSEVIDADPPEDSGDASWNRKGGRTWR